MAICQALKCRYKLFEKVISLLQKEKLIKLMI